MEDIAMNNGDLIVSSYGDISILMNDEDDIIQMANNAISTIKTENMFHQDYGNDAWNRRLKIASSGFSIVEECSQDAILNADERVEEVTSIDAYQGENFGECVVDYTLLTTDGREISSSTNINIL